ncbi:cytidine deaminase-like protein [Linderina pennispora]|uniref:Cytidine deaminase-like protein n=1 Tax=Linderina pennispora TaxID=61395 RepID=A0A1Y1VV98_9FUNG|nr:cytidine deaminase-like protein [Linderina pennispora]ORX65207.1 cytidine deaminase-like protein [Linderina pennispora]
MSFIKSNHKAEDLINTILNTTVKDIIPLTTSGVSSGSKLFGAAIFKKDTLELVHASTNNEQVSPLLHGEVNCIQEFFTQIPAESRPSPKDCIFYATHEPCSLCLSAITWAGFNEFYYLFTYEDSRNEFAIPYDIQILEEVYRVAAPSDTEESLKKRPLYNRDNQFFTSRSVSEVVDTLDFSKIDGIKQRVSEIKRQYHSLSKTYQDGKNEGVQSSAVWA